MTAPRDPSAGLVGIVEADFDGDGKLDVAGPTTPSGFRVLLGDGRGGFKARASYLPDRNGGGIVAADLDGDADIDLVVTSWDSNEATGTVTILFNKGDGAFANPTDLQSFKDYWLVVRTGHVNGDGAVDLVLSGGPRPATVLLNDGHGAFAATDYLVDAGTNYPRGLVVADLDGNGTDDVAVAAPAAPAVTVMFASSDGRLAAPVTYPLMVEEDARTNYLAASDVDGDGKVDLLVSITRITTNGLGSFRSATASVTVLHNAGDGTFSLGGTYPTGVIGGVTDVGDLNGDALPDLALVDESPARLVKVLLNDGHGAFPGPAAGYAAGPDPSAVAIGDLDGDGRADLAVSAKGLTVLRNKGGGTFDAAPVSAGGEHVALGDIDGDGRTDAVTAEDVSGIAVLLGTPGGAFAPAVYDDTVRAVGLALADLDGDGRTDAVAIDWLPEYLEDDLLRPGHVGGYSLHFNDGHGAFRTSARYVPYPDIVAIAVGDLDGDGKPDLALAGQQDSWGQKSPWLSIQLNDGHGSFDRKDPLTVDGTPSALTVGDFDSDGRTDLALTSSDDGSVSIYLNAGAATFRKAGRIEAGKGAGFAAVAAADLDGNGTIDLAVGNSANQSVSVLLRRVNGDFAPAITSQLTGAPSTLAVADLNGDGRREVIAVVDTSVDVLVNAGHGDFEAARSFNGGGAPLSAAAADLNGDGLTDLVVGNAFGTVCTLINDSR